MIVSIVILTKNNADSIKQCLDSVAGISDDIVVVDGQSTDGTIEICKRHRCRVFQHQFDLKTGFSGMRNFGDAKCRHDWILHIDSDEVAAAQLAREIAALDAQRDIAGYRIRRHEYFLGRHYLTTNIVRLFRKKGSRWHRVAHEDLILEGGVGQLSGFIEHLNQKQDIDGLFDKIKRGTREELETWVQAHGEMGRARLLWNMIFQPAKWFFGMLLYKRQILNGIHGLIVSTGAAYYRFFVFARYYEQKYWGR